jgi:hypothetical protein
MKDWFVCGARYYERWVGYALICAYLAIATNILFIYAISTSLKTFYKIVLAMIELLLFIAILTGAIYVTEEYYRKDGIRLLIISGSFALIFNCLLWCYWTQIQIGLSIVEATSRFFFSTKRIFLISFGSVVISMAVLAVALAGAIQIVSMNDFSATE